MKKNSEKYPKGESLDQEIREQRKGWKESAVQIVQGLSDKKLEGYIEPTRARTPKGDPVGFSRKKLRAAHLMILHPNTLSLKTISELTGVRDSVLRVWRVDQDFRKVIKAFGFFVVNKIALTIDIVIESQEIELVKREGDFKISDDGTEGQWVLRILKSKRDQIDAIRDSFSNEIHRIIELDDLANHGEKLKAFNEPSDLLYICINILPHFNELVAEPFARWIYHRVDTNSGYAAVMYSGIAHAVFEVASIRDADTFRKWHRKAENLELMKIIVREQIDFLAKFAGLTKEEIQEVRLTQEEIQKAAEVLKSTVFNMMDNLAR